MNKLLILIILSLLIFTCVSVEEKLWEIKSFPLHGFEEEELKSLNTHIIRMKPNIQSLMIIRNGDLIFEKYYNYTNKDTLFHIYSATKSFTSILVGIAIDQGKIESVEVPFTYFFPEYQVQNPELNKIKIKHLLMMSSGLPGDISWTREQAIECIKNNLIEYIFTQDPYYEPGSFYEYNNLNSHILSIIITKAASMSSAEYAQENLFSHLNITDYEWDKDSEGNVLGPGFLYLKTRDVAKFGMMLCNNGMYNNIQVVSEDWINQAASVHQPGGLPERVEYGFHFWVTEVNGYDAFFAAGHGGQYVYVIRELNLVVIMTSTMDNIAEYHRSIIKNYIIPAIEN